MTTVGLQPAALDLRSISLLGFKPWADKTLPPSERLDAYKSFIRSQVEATLAAVDALDGDARRQLSRWTKKSLHPHL
jgi:hypothetical protein